MSDTGRQLDAAIRITIRSLPVRGPQGLDISIDAFTRGSWRGIVSRDFWLDSTLKENVGRASAWLSVELAALAAVRAKGDDDAHD